MKLKHYQPGLWLALALAGGFPAAAQSNNVPGATDYASFSRFITKRNIFDPGRYASSSSTRPAYRLRASRAAPAFTLVGTISYEKGLFAFFDGNNPDLRKVLSESGGIAGYTVAEVTLAGVKLQTADKKQTVQMKIGEMMRQQGNEWQLTGPGESSASAGDGAATEDSGPDAGTAPAAASSAGEPNDILKKLKQQREQELK